MLKYKIPQIVTLTRIHLPQIVLKKRILIANYLTIRILFGAANGTRTRDPQLGKLMLYQLSYCRKCAAKIMALRQLCKTRAKKQHKKRPCLCEARPDILN